MADRYVKLDDVMDAIGGVPKKKDSPYPTPIHLAAERIVKKIKERIAKVPTADVVEVRHGKWIKRGNEKKCSVCGFIYYSNNDDWNGCPNCLSKMDGKETNVPTK